MRSVHYNEYYYCGQIRYLDLCLDPLPLSRSTHISGAFSPLLTLSPLEEQLYVSLVSLTRT